MPRRNGAGPVGNGPMTGRGMGLCNTNQEDNVRGLGRGFSRGNGRGMGFGYNSTPKKKEDLEQEKNILKQRLSDIEKEQEK
ncbi:MAG: DUF5320 domain-containing protein [Tenericutes bacterium]|nr:DUF5320 domain-containing protein [Mycoplasmatota bacterium]